MLASSLIRWIEQKTGIRNVGLRRLYNTMALAAGENRDDRSLSGDDESMILLGNYESSEGEYESSEGEYESSEDEPMSLSGDDEDESMSISDEESSEDESMSISDEYESKNDFYGFDVTTKPMIELRDSYKVLILLQVLHHIAGLTHKPEILLRVQNSIEEYLSDAGLLKARTGNADEYLQVFKDTYAQYGEHTNLTLEKDVGIIQDDNEFNTFRRYVTNELLRQENQLVDQLDKMDDLPDSKFDRISDEYWELLDDYDAISTFVSLNLFYDLETVLVTDNNILQLATQGD